MAQTIRATKWVKRKGQHLAVPICAENRDKNSAQMWSFNDSAKNETNLIWFVARPFLAWYLARLYGMVVSMTKFDTSFGMVLIGQCQFL